MLPTRQPPDGKEGTVETDPFPALPRLSPTSSSLCAFGLAPRDVLRRGQWNKTSTKKRSQMKSAA